MAEIASFRAALLFLGTGRCGGISIGQILVVEAIEVIGAIGGGLFFGFFAEELLLQATILAAEMFVFLLQHRDPLERGRVHALPITDLLPQLEVFTAHGRHFVAKLRHFQTQLAKAILPTVGILFGPTFFEQKAIHDLLSLT
jgi:hypothetical protein